MSARAARFAHIGQTLFNVETIASIFGRAILRVPHHRPATSRRRRNDQKAPRAGCLLTLVGFAGHELSTDADITPRGSCAMAEHIEGPLYYERMGRTGP